MNSQGLDGEQWLRTVVTSYYYWNSKRWMLEDETWQTRGHVMDSVIKSDVNECTRSAASVQETEKLCFVLPQAEGATASQGPPVIRWLQDQRLSVYAFTAMNNNEITVITLLMLMMVCIFEAVILTEV